MNGIKRHPYDIWFDEATQGVAFSAEIRSWMERAYERGFVDGAKYNAERKVSKALDRTWQDLTHAEVFEAWRIKGTSDSDINVVKVFDVAGRIAAKLKEKNA